MPLIPKHLRVIPVDGGFVKNLSIFAVSVLIALIGLSGSALAQSAQILPLPDSPVATDIPGARELPDPNIIYKVVFDISKASPAIDEVNPGLISIAR
jgi:hypothetical protein